MSLELTLKAVGGINFICSPGFFFLLQNHLAFFHCHSIFLLSSEKLCLFPRESWGTISCHAVRSKWHARVSFVAFGLLGYLYKVKVLCSAESGVQNLLPQTKLAHSAYFMSCNNWKSSWSWVEPLDGKLGAANSNESNRDQS